MTWHQILFFRLFTGFIRSGIRKDLFFRVKSQKNDTIGYATLITPKMTLGIKPGMYGSLLSAHERHYCLENLHYCIFDCISECCHECIRETCTVDSRGLLSKPPCDYERQGRGFCQKHQSVATMAFSWCSYPHPPQVCVVLSGERW